MASQFLSDFFSPAATSESASEQSSTALTRPAEFTSAQQQLQQLAAGQGGLQLQNLLRALGLQQNVVSQLDQPQTALQDLGLQQAEQTTQSTLGRRSALDQLFQGEVDRIQRGAQATPEQRQLIGDIAQRRIASGTSDINAALQESLGLLRSELAPSRGLRPEDTPVQDRGQVLARESLRLTEDLVNQARAQESQQLLEFPLAESQLRSGQTRSLQDVGLAEGAQSLQLQQFQDALRNQDFQRRLAAGQLGLSLAQIGPTNVGQFTPPGTISTATSQGRSTSESRGQGLGTQVVLQGLGSLLGTSPGDDDGGGSRSGGIADILGDIFRGGTDEGGGIGADIIDVLGRIFRGGGAPQEGTDSESDATPTGGTSSDPTAGLPAPAGFFTDSNRRIYLPGVGYLDPPGTNDSGGGISFPIFGGGGGGGF